jgi:hypothetical protein
MRRRRRRRIIKYHRTNLSLELNKSEQEVPGVLFWLSGRNVALLT